MFQSMGRWVIIWGAAGLFSAGAAYALSPAGNHHVVREVGMIFPWAALWASLVAHAPLTITIRRVQHVTVAALLALFVTVSVGLVANARGSLDGVSTRLLVLAGLAAVVFAGFGTIYAICATVASNRRRRPAPWAESPIA